LWAPYTETEVKPVDIVQIPDDEAYKLPLATLVWGIKCYLPASFSLALAQSDPVGAAKQLRAAFERNWRLQEKDRKIAAASKEARAAGARKIWIGRASNKRQGLAEAEEKGPSQNAREQQMAAKKARYDQCVSLCPKRRTADSPFCEDCDNSVVSFGMAIQEEYEKQNQYLSKLCTLSGFPGGSVVPSPRRRVLFYLGSLLGHLILDAFPKELKRPTLYERKLKYHKGTLSRTFIQSALRKLAITGGPLVDSEADLRRWFALLKEKFGDPRERYSKEQLRSVSTAYRDSRYPPPPPSPRPPPPTHPPTHLRTRSPPPRTRTTSKHTFTICTPTLHRAQTTFQTPPIRHATPRIASHPF
jgi:hypothetical protein